MHLLTRLRTASPRAFRALALAGFAALASTAALAQQQRIAGDVASVEGGMLLVRTAAGESLHLKLADGTRVTARAKTDWSAIAQGSYVGTTAVPQADGTLLAKEVHVFTEAQRGTGEGSYPMSTPGDTMTNATVAKMGPAAAARDTMTNATVASAAGAAGGHRLTLTYKGGEKTVVVPDDVPIIASEPGDRSLLVPGAHVVAYARRDADGSLTLERISVGKNGFATPI